MWTYLTENPSRDFPVSTRLDKHVDLFDREPILRFPGEYKVRQIISDVEYYRPSIHHSVCTNTLICACMCVRCRSCENNYVDRCGYLRIVCFSLSCKALCVQNRSISSIILLLFVYAYCCDCKQVYIKCD